MQALADRPPRPRRAWNRIPLQRASAIIDLALAEPSLSPRELAVKYTDTYRSNGDYEIDAHHIL